MTAPTPATAPATAPDRTRTAAPDGLGRLLDGMAGIFAAEGRPGGDLAAAALRAAVSAPRHRLDERTHLGPVLAHALAAPDAHPLAGLVAAAGDAIPWHYSGLSDGRIRPEIAHHMATTYLLGPRDAVVHSEHVWSGIFLQSPGLDYPERVHAAEETFFVLSGTAEWSCNGIRTRHGPGAYVHHPSNAPHTSVTGPEPLLAIWRWTGEIDMKTYLLKG